MFNISDLIAIALVALAMFLGYKRGFVKTSFRVLSFILALILSLVLYKPVGNLIKKHTGVETWIVSVVTGANKEKQKEEIEEVELEENKTEENEIEEGVKNLPQNIKDYLDVDGMVEKAKTQYIDDVKLQLAHKIADIAINIMSMIIVYVVIRLILIVVCFILDGIMKMPVLKQINEISGLLLGFALGLMQVYIILMIITFLSSVIQIPGIINYIKSSLIVRYLFEYNLLIKLIF